MLDEKRRLFGLVNPVDLVALLLVVAVVVMMITVLVGRSPGGPIGSSATSTVEVVATATLPDLDVFLYRVGDKVGRVGGGYMGVLQEVTANPARVESFDAAGTPVVVTSEVFVDVRFTIRGQGTLDDAGASIGDERIRQNQTLDIQMPQFQAPVRVQTIRVVD